MVTVFGYGSLMTYQSVLKTMPNAIYHRRGTLLDHQRIFSLVSVTEIRNKTANFDTGEIAALGVRPSHGSRVEGVLFDIPRDEISEFEEREHRYIVKQLPVTCDQDSCKSAYVATAQTDKQYRQTMSADEYQERVGQYY